MLWFILFVIATIIAAGALGWGLYWRRRALFAERQISFVERQISFVEMKDSLQGLIKRNVQ
jgi:hypothetical protein